MKLSWWNNGATYERGTGGPLWPVLMHLLEGAYPDIKINTVDIPFDDFQTKVLTGLAARDTGDVVDVHPVHAFTLAMRGALLNLSPNLAQIGFPQSDFTPAWQYNYWKGKYWALPRSDAPHVILYNKKMVTDAGLPDPYELFKQGKWDLPAWDKMISTVTKGEGPQRVFGAMGVWRSLRIQCVWLWGTGGDVWSEDETETRIAEDETLKAWDYLASWTKNRISPSPAEANIPGGWVSLFGQRRLASYITGAQYVLGNDTDFIPADVLKEAHLVPMNKLWNGKNQGRNATDGHGISLNTRYRDDAWRASAFMLSDTAQTIILRERWTSPLRKSWLSGELWRQLQKPDFEGTDVWTDVVNNVRALSHVPRFSEIDQIAQKAYDSIVLGQKSSKAAMTEAKPGIDKILKDVATEAKQSQYL